jgi:hypothetical protein
MKVNKIKKIKGNIIELGEGKNIVFYEIANKNIVSDIIYEKVSYVEEYGW